MGKILLTIFILSTLAYAEELSIDSTRISYPRLALSAVGTLGAMGGAYFVVQNAWWSESSIGFHFDNGIDLEYAKNIDKAAHFYGGYVIQDLYYRSLMWSRLDKKSSIIWSTSLSCFVQIVIDVKDGYSPDWGFSPWDVITGSMGAGYGALQKIYPAFDNYDIKFSYFYRKDNYGPPRSWEIENFIEDYPNQTYWLTANINNLLPVKARKIIPDYLGLAFGAGVDDKIMNKYTGDYELCLSIDFDLEKIVQPMNNRVVSSIAHYLNYIKIPAPALRFYPSAKGYWLYM